MKVTIYSTTTCPYCKMEREYLKNKNIAFEDILVDQDLQKAEEMMRFSGQLGVPFTVIVDDQNKQTTILGFDKTKIDQALGIS